MLRLRLTAISFSKFWSLVKYLNIPTLEHIDFSLKTLWHIPNLKNLQGVQDQILQKEIAEAPQL